MGRTLRKTQSKVTEEHQKSKVLKSVNNVYNSEIDSRVFEEPKYNAEGPAWYPKSHEKPSETYNMNHRRRGVAIIFNHTHFKKLGVRLGAEKDSDNLAKTLMEIGFDVRVYIDPSLEAIISALHTTAAEDHTDADCLVIAVMTHGESGFLHSAECLYSIDILWNSFNSERCPTLVGKPKLFFVQASGKMASMKGMHVINNVDYSSSCTTPNGADIMVVYSTCDGTHSCRNTATGSYFIQVLCKELQERWQTHELFWMMTAVTREVIIQTQSLRAYDHTLFRGGQIPTIVSTLTGSVYFKPKESKMRPISKTSDEEKVVYSTD